MFVCLSAFGSHVGRLLAVPAHLFKRSSRSEEAEGVTSRLRAEFGSAGV
jgi:hypothetical protein